MSDDIPPLIPETPPPITKLDWEDDEDFMDFPHLALEMSDSSLSPDGGWNTIDELSLPYDGDVDKPNCIGSSTNDCSSNWPSSITNNDQLLESSEHELSSHQNNLSIWKDKENIIEKIEKSTSNHDCSNINEKTKIEHNKSVENVVNNIKQIEDISSLNTEEHTQDEKHVKYNIISQCSTNLEHQLDNSESVKHNEIVQTGINVDLEKLYPSETLVNGHLECIDSKELSNKVKRVQNELLLNNISDINTKVNSNNSLPERFNNHLSINNNNNNNNNNNKIKNVQEEVRENENPNFACLPNEILLEQSEIVEKYQHIEQFPDQIPVTQINYDYCELSQNISIPKEENVEKNVTSINLNCSALQNQQTNEINFENNSDSEFDKFSDFHTFSTTENEPISAKNDDEFCDFESGFNENHLVDIKQNELSISESHVQFDYKQFCMDTFQGDYELCEKIDLQNLDNELNASQIWNNLKDIESSPALNYNWSKSNSNSVFLSSLSIDSRNILYGASWNQKVPKFAANMSDSPLEPLKASNNSTIDTKISQFFSNHPLQEIVPDPEFDWTSSGLINPLDCNQTSLLDLELLDTLSPCCTNTLQPETWKTSQVLSEKFMKNGEEYTESINDFEEFFSVSFDNQFTESNENPKSDEVTVSLSAQRILDNLPDFEVLQKSYLVILNKENKYFLN